MLLRGFSFSRVKVLRKYGRITRKFHQYEIYNLLHAFIILTVLSVLWSNFTASLY